MIRCIVDAHAHLYPIFDFSAALDSAARSFHYGREAMGASLATPGVLLLASPSGVSEFQRLQKTASDSGSIGGWLLAPAGADAVIANRQNQPPLLLVAGRQIRTGNRLEVLALATQSSFDDGMTLRSTIRHVLDSGGVAVIPWGFGKWRGARGREVRVVLHEFAEEPVWLGDSAGRLDVGPTPPLLQDAERDGRIVLPGSDPLPLRGHEHRLGRCGFGLHVDPLGADPAIRIRTALRTLDESPPRYGSYERLLPFLDAQIRMQIARLMDS